MPKAGGTASASPFLGDLDVSPVCTTSLSPAAAEKRRTGHKDQRVWEEVCSQGAESERKEMKTVESKETTTADQ